MLWTMVKEFLVSSPPIFGEENWTLNWPLAVVTALSVLKNPFELLIVAGCLGSDEVARPFELAMLGDT